MILDTESWMNIRRFRALHAAGARFVQIGRECGCDWRTVRKYLAETRPPSRRRHRLERAPSLD
jgi:transposase